MFAPDRGHAKLSQQDPGQHRWRIDFQAERKTAGADGLQGLPPAASRRRQILPPPPAKVSPGGTARTRLEA